MTHFSVRSRLEPLILLDPEPTQMGWRQSRLRDLELPEPEPPKKVAALQHWSLVYPVLSVHLFICLFSVLVCLPVCLFIASLHFCLPICSFISCLSWFVYPSVRQTLVYNGLPAHLIICLLSVLDCLFISVLPILVCLTI